MPDGLAGKRILVTGATGFIGRWLVEALQSAEYSIHALARDPVKVEGIWPATKVTSHYGDLAKPATLDNLCADMGMVFHLAGFSGSDEPGNPGDQDGHRRVTVEGTRALLAAARRAGVQRFVFVSSVKAMGESGDRCLDEASPTEPESAYGRAKLAAEHLILAVEKEQEMQVCILRLPLVYGRDNKGNIPRMIAAIDRGRFPPLPEVRNKRSMVHVEDVVQALLLAVARPEARGKIYIVTDGQIYSSREIYTLICQTLGRPISKWIIPRIILMTAASLGDGLGRLGLRVPLNSEVIDKLLGSACYSSNKISRELGYRPTHTLADALPEMVEYYRTEVKREV